MARERGGERHTGTGTRTQMSDREMDAYSEKKRKRQYFVEECFGAEQSSARSNTRVREQDTIKKKGEDAGALIDEVMMSRRSTARRKTASFVGNERHLFALREKDGEVRVLYALIPSWVCEDSSTNRPTE